MSNDAQAAREVPDYMEPPPRKATKRSQRRVPLCYLCCRPLRPVQTKAGEWVKADLDGEVHRCGP